MNMPKKGLSLNKETVAILSSSHAHGVQGGMVMMTNTETDARTCTGMKTIDGACSAAVTEGKCASGCHC